MISIIIPVYNEEDNLVELHTQLEHVFQSIRAPYEYVFVNDGSKDASLDILLSLRKKNSHVKVVDFSRNFGHQIAITAGMEHAKGDAVIIMDADLQDPPDVIPQLIEEWKKGHDIVYAKRKERVGDDAFKKFCASAYYKFLGFLTDIDVPQEAGDFRLFSRRAVDYLNSMKEKRRYIRGLSSWIGFKQTGVAYVRPARFAGRPKYSFFKSLRLAIEGITSLSLKPLRLATYLGCIFSVWAFLYMGFIIYRRLCAHEYVPGWAAMMTVILFLGGVQLLCLGVIGEYIGRISEESRGRPLYIIDKVYD